MSKQQKKVSVFLQAKGGVGKSFLAFFKLLTVEPEKTAVILLDSSQKANQNAGRHRKVVGEKNVKTWDIYNSAHEYKKSHFFDVFENCAGLEAQNIILDFGAPESNVLREALSSDEEVTGENLRYVADELSLDISFNVVVSGADDNVNENIDYFKAINQALNQYFPVRMLINDYTFKADGDSELLKNALLEKGVASENQLSIVGKTGNRNNDNAYLIIASIANGETTLEDGRKNMSVRIRLRNLTEPLASL